MRQTTKENIQGCVWDAVDKVFDNNGGRMELNDTQIGEVQEILLESFLNFYEKIIKGD